VSSVLPTLVAIAILATIAYSIWRMRPTREALQRRRAAAAGVTQEMNGDFEQRAVHIARSILNAAITRLETSANEQGLPTAVALEASEQDAEPLAAGGEMRAAARQLASALRAYRRLHEEAFATRECEQAEERWAYLSVVFGDRFPLLADCIERSDLSSLECIGAGPAPEAAGLLRSELDARVKSYREIISSLEEEPSLIWSLLSLVVLTLSQLELDEAKQSALAARANARTADSWVALMAAHLKSALHIAHTAPPATRILHQGVLALPLDDRDLGAALIQYCANEATALGELDQARVLVMGDTTMLWLAHDVIRVCGYPDRAIDAYAELAPLVRTAIRARPEEAGPALGGLSQAAKDRLDEPTSARILQTVEQLRSGQTAEQVRAGALEHESEPA
jgi:hypothetical protein